MKVSHHACGSCEKVKEAEQKQMQELPEVHRERRDLAKIPSGHSAQGVLQLLDVVRHSGLQSAHGHGEGE